MLSRYSSSEIRFTLLALTKSKAHQATDKIAALRRDKGAYLEALARVQGPAFDSSQFPDLHECVVSAQQTQLAAAGMKLEVQETGADALLAKILLLNSEIAVQEEVLAEDRQRRERYRLDNERRKHNYIPFILELLSIASESGNLKEQFDKAKTAASQSQTPAGSK